MLRELHLKDTRCAEAGVCSEFVTGCPLKCGRGVPKLLSLLKNQVRERSQFVERISLSARRTLCPVSLNHSARKPIDFGARNKVLGRPIYKENVTMKKLGYFAVCTMLTMGICVAQDLVNIILGTIKKVDSNTKTIVVETANGTEHTIKVTDAVTVKGTRTGSTA
jgi:hypothetical protein